MAVVAITPIKHGKEDGTTLHVKVGKPVEGLSEDEERVLVETGSAVETGETKKYKSPYYNPLSVGEAGAVDMETRERDALIAGIVAPGAPSEPGSSTNDTAQVEGLNVANAPAANVAQGKGPGGDTPAPKTTDR